MCENKSNNMDFVHEQCTLLQHGYQKMTKISNTLQGEVYLAKTTYSLANNKNKNPETGVAIKTALKSLHNIGAANINGITVKVQENIIREMHIIKSLQETGQAPPPLIKYIDFFEDDQRYYLVTENGGKSLFRFVVECHALIAQNKLDIREWRKHCKHMFAQMVQFQLFMHSHGCCNLDISLENILISNDVRFENGKLYNCHIKFIDFGLAEYFANDNFACAKFVGKTTYMAPQVYSKKQLFDARKADIWSLGVVLFSMITGRTPYARPCADDSSFRLVRNGKMLKLLNQMKKGHYFTVYALDLVEQILTVDESQRIGFAGICGHKWIRHYFNDLAPCAPSLKKSRGSVVLPNKSRGSLVLFSEAPVKSKVDDGNGNSKPHMLIQSTSNPATFNSNDMINDVHSSVSTNEQTAL